jgi:hypothetical protein
MTRSIDCIARIRLAQVAFCCECQSVPLRAVRHGAGSGRRTSSGNLKYFFAEFARVVL